MKKILLLSFFLLPFSVFAGIDTDAICSDDSIYGKQMKRISVTYPNEKVHVTDAWKVIENYKNIISE